MPKHHSDFATAEPHAGRYEIADDDVPGLRLSIQPTGAKSWCVRYTAAGRDKKFTLGNYQTIPLSKARKLAADVLLQVRAGRDPQADKVSARAEAKAATRFGVAYDSYLANNEWKPKTLKDIKGTFRRVLLPKFKHRALADLSAREIKNVVDKSSDPRRVFMICRAFLNWTVSELLLPASPMAGLKPPATPKARERKLSSDEIKLVWDAATKAGYPFGDIVRLLLLTGCRRDEVAGMRRSEVEGAEWTIPAARVKNDCEHVVYLAPEALAILGAAPKIRSKSAYVFTTNGRTQFSGFSKAKTALDEASGVNDWVIHDLRRTVASNMAALGIALPVIERCLNHISGSFAGIVGVYQRHEFASETRDAWQRWAARLAEIVADRD